MKNMNKNLNGISSETARLIEQSTETMLQILPVTDTDGKAGFMVFAADRAAVEQLQNGVDIGNVLQHGYFLASGEGEITNIVIRMREGMPLLVSGVEELPDGSSRNIVAQS